MTEFQKRGWLILLVALLVLCLAVAAFVTRPVAGFVIAVAAGWLIGISAMYLDPPGPPR